MSKMIVNKLKYELKRINLRKLGKNYLVQRLLQEKLSGVTASSPTNAQPNNSLHDGLKWVLLTPEDQTVPEPTTPFKLTNPTENVCQGRQNMKEKFKITPFTHTSKLLRRVGTHWTLVMEGSKPKEVDIKRIMGRDNI